MADTSAQIEEQTAADDVRRVRVKIAAEHRGDLREHMEETNRIFETLRVKLNLKVVPSPPKDSRRSGTQG